MYLLAGSSATGEGGGARREGDIASAWATLEDAQETAASRLAGGEDLRRAHLQEASHDYLARGFGSMRRLSLGPSGVLNRSRPPSRRRRSCCLTLWTARCPADMIVCACDCMAHACLPCMSHMPRRCGRVRLALLPALSLAQNRRLSLECCVPACCLPACVLRLCQSDSL